MKSKSALPKKPLNMKQWEKSPMDKKDDKRELKAENKKIVAKSKKK